MTRKAHLEPHLSSEELKARYRSTVDKVESRRWHLLWLVSAQWTIKAAAAAVGLSYDYALELVKNYNQGGQEALKNKHKGRKPSKKKNALLDELQLAELKQCLHSPPADQGSWTGPKVAQWIATRTGREKVWPQRGWDYLKKWHYSLKVPRPKHHKGDIAILK
ncbi:winged helix-turn-helix domain-containing protein [Chroococcidiopsis sp. CCMEE 29]|uniref:helix-turn-helix domain-containing protein n=1 Tax=Chroococcidiopsis sp. CCMEE 29 TaxID=155894 RepID=UPI0020200163|nr:winged helix-turn-helix domain-containing protein [Chroococcidiopsis sp. CCMEE 29]